MIDGTSIVDIIRRRFSCRAYLETPIERGKLERLEALSASFRTGPLGSSVRFRLVAAAERDRGSTMRLGTYGFIRGAPAFIVGAVAPTDKGLEDYGYAMERIILHATGLGLGTCWLGGSFSKSGFGRSVSVEGGETVPAVSPVGVVGDPEKARNTAVRRVVRADRRLPWEKLFFRSSFSVPLARDEAGAYAVPLEMVRLGPSASNKQPWRIVREGRSWHFFLRRTRGYRNFLAAGVFKVADLQRIDMGIAMCHFELAADESGLKGEWTVREPAIERPDELTEYTVSWAEAHAG